jgi:tripartite ATP-independent transporter DctM subunit
MIAIHLTLRRNPNLAPMGEPTTVRQKLLAIKGIWAMLVLFLLVIGGMYSGIFTAVEAGAIGTVGAFLFAVARRMLSRKKLEEAFLDTAEMCGMILILFIGISILNSSLALSEIQFTIANFIGDLEISRWIIFLGIVLMYMAFGFIMNVFAIIMLTIPILLPTYIALDFNLIWLGVVMVLMTMIGTLTPPIGVACFIVSGLDEAKDISIGQIFRGVTPLWISMIVATVLISVFPQIATFLPNLLK